MKKKAFLLLIAGTLLFIGCSDLNRVLPDSALTQVTNEYVPLRDRVSVDDLESSFSKTVWHMINATEMILKTVENYVDVSELEMARSIKNDTFDIWAYAESLPSDLTTRKRQRSMAVFQGRSTLDSDSLETVTLQDELNEIVDYYTSSVEQIMPSLDYDNLPYGIVVEDDFIHMPGGNVIYQYSLDGIAAIEVLNAIANGEDPEAAAQKISEEIENMLGYESTDTVSARGLFINPILKWQGGTVRYTFDSNMRSNYKTATRNAMNDWEAGSGGKVKFIQMEQNTINGVLALIGTMPLLSISEKALVGASGEASPGSPLPGIPFVGIVYSHMYIDPDVPDSFTEKKNERNAYRVALHELGHVLGLQHEHQRFDRDKYIKVTDTGSQYSKIPEITLTSVVDIRIEWRSKKVLFITVYYPVIVVVTQSHPQFQKTTFDPLSIMIYSGFEIICQDFKDETFGNKDDKTGIWKTKLTTRLSDKDKVFIRLLY